MRVYHCLSLAAVCTVLGGGTSRGQEDLLDQLAGKKLIAFGWDSPSGLM